MPDVLVVGELCLDITIHKPRGIRVCCERAWDERITLSPGGSAFFASQTFSALGFSTAIRAAVGDDWVGEYLMSELSRVGVDVKAIRQVEGKETQKAIAVCDETNEYPTACSEPISGISQQVELPSGLKVLYVAGFLLYPEMWGDEFGELLSRVRRKNALIAVDTQWLPISPEKVAGALNPLVLGQVDTLFMNSKEARLLAGTQSLEAAASRLSKLGPSLIVVKLGERGSLVYREERTVQRAAFPVAIRSTIGAGDVFGAAFCYGLLMGWSLSKTSDFANAAAALSITTETNRPPSLDNILELAQPDQKADEEFI